MPTVLCFRSPCTINCIPSGALTKKESWIASGAKLVGAARTRNSMAYGAWWGTWRFVGSTPSISHCVSHFLSSWFWFDELDDIQKSNHTKRGFSGQGISEERNVSAAYVVFVLKVREADCTSIFECMCIIWHASRNFSNPWEYAVQHLPLISRAYYRFPAPAVLSLAWSVFCSFLVNNNASSRVLSYRVSWALSYVWSISFLCNWLIGS